MTCSDVGSKSHGEGYGLNEQANCLDDYEYGNEWERGTLGKKVCQ